MIQGEMTQAAREKVMNRIKAGNLRFLVATDVAARGIDISDLSHVISYTSSDSPEVYLHRTGRTGRAGRTGTAISLVSGLDIANFRNMQNVNRMKIPERPIPSGSQLSERLRQRIQVRLEHDLREMPERERATRRSQFVPIVAELLKSDEGRLELAMVLATYLRTPPREATENESADEPAPEPEDRDDRSARSRGGSDAPRRGGGRGGRRRRR
jgi:ATP-dependent RNA helicase DeaD